MPPEAAGESVSRAHDIARSTIFFIMSEHRFLRTSHDYEQPVGVNMDNYMTIEWAMTHENTHAFRTVT